MLGWDFPIEYCEQPHYLVDFEKDVFYFPNADVRVLGRAGGRVRNLALSVAEIGFCGVPGTVGGDVLVPRWVVGGKVSDEESVRQREEFHGMQRTFRHWDQDYEDTETHVDTEPAHEEKFLKSLTLVGDGERVLLGMEAKFGVGAERDFEHSYWEWVGGDLPLPVERTSLDEEPDHPYWKLYRKRLDNVQGALESEPVRQAYEGIGVKFELWRRPRQEGFWRKTARG
ncbi:hypothetical protein BKA65DRAFT_511795 [Rhexocercosporidium sp. MPI-PUGE-AT-0058]|nr:hypothetical protein BKA65DRAFT_511795 [Rhexocercosporidium sp. MPI-PUGE-AT-0058]